VEGPVALGFRRLAILDLSSAGHQPMSDPEQTVWIVFNGEIYNFKEIRKELEYKGHSFRSNCDTEVIVLGYKEWGENVLKRLNGMFGLAIWDVARRRLIVARDAMGIKPVYYSLIDGTLWFGSEIRPILAAIPQRPGIDPAAVNQFLRYRYTPAPYTIHQGIRKLAAGEMLTIENGHAEISRWYTYQPKPFSPQPSDDDAAEELLDLYQKAVRRHLISDVPVGLLLSGGLDSGLLLGLMNKEGADWPTFTVGYGNTFADDELEDAEETARIFGANHHSIRIDRATFEASLPKIIAALEEPVASSSIVPMYFVCERARRDVKVALIGQGPDELFGGYTRHIGVQHGKYWRSLPTWLRSTLAAGLDRLPRNEALKRGLYALGTRDRLQRFKNVFSVQPASVVDGLFRPGILPQGAGDSVLESWSPLMIEARNLDELNAFQHLELRSSLPDELLMYGDKLSMVHALETRVPYLDREVVEYVQRLEAHHKVRWRTSKWLHRRVCQAILPKTILSRRKRGFAVNVVDDWLRNANHSRFSEHLDDSEAELYKIIDKSAVQTLRDEHSKGRHDHHKILFSILLLEQWLRAR
jgi:asparagine synthase (glutamine-hydrolysing)